MSSQRIQWEGEYIEQAIADEIELAWLKHRVRVAPESSYLISATRLVPVRGTTLLPGHSRTTPDTWSLPQWRRSWSAAGPLATELGLSIRHDQEEGTVSAGTGSRRRDVTEAYADHPDRDAATMAAIVRASIRMCVEAREQC